MHNIDRAVQRERSLQAQNKTLHDLQALLQVDGRDEASFTLGEFGNLIEGSVVESEKERSRTRRIHRDRLDIGGLRR